MSTWFENCWKAPRGCCPEVGLQGELRFDPIVDPDCRAFSQFSELYVASFPPDEREDLAKFPLWIVPGRTPARGAGERNELLGAFLDGQLAGFAFYGLLSRPSFAFLIYIAVEPRHRGAGIGAKLFAEVVRRAQAHSAERGDILEAVLLEVERVDDAPNEAGRFERIARLRFFEKQGARILSRTYTQPALRPNSNPVPLNLLWLPLRETAKPGSLVQSLYRRAFAIDDEHPFVAQALEGMTESQRDA